MNDIRFGLAIVAVALLSVSFSAPAVALGACEKKAATCNRQTDIEFRQDRKALGDSEARGAMDVRRRECRTAMKKCKRKSVRMRDLKLDYRASAGGGYSRSSSPGVSGAGAGGSTSSR
jgi:hypothetical protein